MSFEDMIKYLIKFKKHDNKYVYMIIKMFQVNGDILEAYVLELQTIHEWTLLPKAIIQEGNMINTQLQ